MLFAGCRGCGSKAYEPGRIDVVDGVLVASVERTTAPEPKVAPLPSLDFDRLVHALELDPKARATWLAALEPGDQFTTVLVAPLKTAQALKRDGLLAYGDELGGRRANAP